MKASLQPAKSFSPVASSTAQRKGLQTVTDNRPTALAQRKMQGVVQAKSVVQRNKKGVSERQQINNGYHKDEERGDAACSQSNMVEAIKFYKRAIAGRQEARGLHATDWGHNNAITVLQGKLARAEEALAAAQLAAQTAQQAMLAQNRAAAAANSTFTGWGNPRN
jgi:hypothetical protein